MSYQILKKSPKNLCTKFQFEKPNFRDTLRVRLSEGGCERFRLKSFFFNIYKHLRQGNFLKVRSCKESVLGLWECFTPVRSLQNYSGTVVDISIDGVDRLEVIDQISEIRLAHSLPWIESHYPLDMITIEKLYMNNGDIWCWCGCKNAIFRWKK